VANIMELHVPFTPFTLGQVVWSLIILALGVLVSNWLARMFRGSLLRAGLPELIADVFSKLFKALLYVSVVLLAVRALGVGTGSVVVGLSAVIGLVLGFGMQDTMNNLAAGVWIAVTRPFDKGDYVEVAGYSGTVSEVGILSTVLVRPDNEVVLIPNRSVWGKPIVNYTRNPTRRVNIQVGVAYGTDLDRAVRTALDIVRGTPGVLMDPQPQVVIAGLGDSSVNLAIRAWARKEDYWAVRERIIRGVYERFAAEGIEIPYPQLDVHIRDMPGGGVEG